MVLYPRLSPPPPRHLASRPRFVPTFQAVLGSSVVTGNGSLIATGYLHTVPGTDTFETRPNGALGVPWVAFNSLALPTVSSGEVYSNTDTAPTDVALDPLWTGVNVQVDITFGSTLNATRFTDVYGRISTTGASPDYYVFRMSGANWQLRRCVAGTETTINQVTRSQTITTVEGMRLTCIGSTITGYCKVSGSWTQVITATDSNITAAGYIGFGTARSVGGASGGGIEDVTWGLTPGAAISISGNGSVATSRSKGGLSSVSISANGTVVPNRLKNSFGNITMSAGGATNVSARKNSASTIVSSANGTSAPSGRKGALSSVTASANGSVAVTSTKESGQGSMMGKPQLGTPIVVFGNLYPRLDAVPQPIYPPIRWVGSSQSTNRIGSLSVSGNGSITTVGQKGVSGTTSISGNGSLVIGAGVKFTSIAISGKGIVAVTANKRASVSLALSSNGSVTIIGVKGARSTRSELNGVPPMFLMAVGTRIFANGSVVATGTRVAGSTAATGGGSIVSSGRKGGSTSVALSGRGFTLVNGALAAGNGIALITQGGVLNVSGRKQALSTLVLSGNGNIATTAAKSARLNASIGASGSVNIVKRKGAASGIVVTGSGSSLGLGRKSGTAPVTSTARGNVTALGFGVRLVQVSGGGQNIVTGRHSASRNVSVSGNGILNVQRNKSAFSSVSISAAPQITIVGFGVLLGEGFAHIEGQGNLSIVGNKQARLALSMSRGGTITVKLTKAFSGGVSVNGSGDIVIRSQRPSRNTIGRIYGRVGGSTVKFARRPRNTPSLS